KEYAEKARQQLPGNSEVESLIARISASQSKLEYIMTLRVPVKKRADYLNKQKSIADLLLEGREYFNAKDYNNAEVTYAQVLRQDEYNAEAMRYLKKIGEIKYDAHSLERDATQAAMMDDVRKTWTPPHREEIEMPKLSGGPTNILGGSILQK